MHVPLYSTKANRKWNEACLMSLIFHCNLADFSWLIRPKVILPFLMSYLLKGDKNCRVFYNFYLLSLIRQTRSIRLSLWCMILVGMKASTAWWVAKWTAQRNRCLEVKGSNLGKCPSRRFLCNLTNKKYIFELKMEKDSSFVRFRLLILMRFCKMSYSEIAMLTLSVHYEILNNN